MIAFMFPYFKRRVDPLDHRENQDIAAFYIKFAV